jgi:hypothetical protein
VSISGVKATRSIQKVPIDNAKKIPDASKKRPPSERRTRRVCQLRTRRCDCDQIEFAENAREGAFEALSVVWRTWCILHLVVG